MKLFYLFLIAFITDIALSCVIYREKEGPIFKGADINVQCGDDNKLTIGVSSGQTVKSCERKCKLETRCRWFEF